MISSFNPRTHEGCDINRSDAYRSDIAFQSTHPRGVRLSWQLRTSTIKEVSIHAPTRGATIFLFSSFLLFLCFNPRTHEGCDFSCPFARLCYTCFNPRTHEGCDECGINLYVREIVSIHAPTRGATLMGFHKVHNKAFQSTHPRGVRLIGSSNYAFSNEFQSTHPRGVRQDVQ